MKNGFEKGGEANGFDVEVQIAGDDDAQQLSQVQAMLQKQPCALALNPVKSSRPPGSSRPLMTQASLSSR